MADNSLSGTLPAGILQLSLLQDLWLTQNRISGQLLEFTSLPAFSTLFLVGKALGPYKLRLLKSIKHIWCTGSAMVSFYPLDC